jgi:hypothetical protein
MKNIFNTIIILFIFLYSASVYSQATAMDVEQNDCDGAYHHLFAGLDAGNVIILDYVMLNCAPCIMGTKALESITAPYEVSNPGRVDIYSFAFLNSVTCDQILAWKRDNNFKHRVFTNGEEQVNYYGGMGMPTIVVVGTNEHKVFFKSIGYTSSMDDQIRQAIDSALLYNPSGVGETIGDEGFRIYPTLFSDHLSIETGKEFSGAQFTFFDAYGRQVFSSVIPESGKLSLALPGLSKGLYIARLKNSKGLSAGIRLICR